MISTIVIRVCASSPDIPLDTLVAHRTSPSSVRILDIPKKIGTWEITRVYLQATYPDNSVQTSEAVRSGSVWIATIPGAETDGKCENGFRIIADGLDENGEPVTGYILGIGDVVILPIDGSVSPESTAWAMHMYPEKPESPHKGDAVLTNDNTLEIYNGTEWVSTSVNLDNYIHVGDNFLVHRGRADTITLWYESPERPQKKGNHVEIGADHIEIAAGVDGKYTDISPGSITLEKLNGQPPIVQIGWQGGYGMLDVGNKFSCLVEEDYTELTWDGHNILTDADVMLDETRKGYVAFANHADYSDNASYAGTAETANRDSSGNVITSTYATKVELQNAIGNVLTEDF